MSLDFNIFYVFTETPQLSMPDLDTPLLRCIEMIDGDNIITDPLCAQKNIYTRVIKEMDNSHTNQSHIIFDNQKNDNNCMDGNQQTTLIKFKSRYDRLIIN